MQSRDQHQIAGDTVPMPTESPAAVALRRDLPEVAWRPVGAAMIALAVVLTALSDRYGFHRDELYFRMLSPAWGYVDQPPFTPLIAHAAAALSTSAWVMRIPATACSVLALLIVVLITREFGGGPGAQRLCAWSYASAAIPLSMGHLLLTSTVDLVSWPLLCLFVIRALLRQQPRWWLAAGLVLGLETYNKLLIVLLVLALVIGIVIAGPRRALWSRWLVAGAVLAAVLAVPNVAYQATHSWPQLTMGRALSEHNGSNIRIVMWPYLLLLLGPPLVPIWVAGLVALVRRESWRPVRFLVSAFGVLLLETFVGGGQLYYPLGLLVVVFAAGCVPAADFLADSARWRLTARVLITVNAVVSALIGLPLLPLSALANSPIPGINQLQGDQVGWPDYVDQIASVYRSIPAAEASHTVLIASNYGEAGAVVRYGPRLGLPRPYSGQNQLYFDSRPPADTTTVVVIGGQVGLARERFDSCTQGISLRSLADVDNEEQGELVVICRGPTQSWAALWPAFQHYD
jgi:4-amino-4-deoxy-L-arabinose transferase-like glycosyltransferase